MVKPLVVAVIKAGRLETGGDQSLLCCLRIVRQDVQIPVLAGSGVGIATCDQRTLYHDQLAVVGVADP